VALSADGNIAVVGGFAEDGGVALVFTRTGAQCDPPPLKWSDLRYVFDIKEDCNGKEAIQA
jgi:hypothetical protein